MLEEDGHWPIDLTKGPVLRVRLYCRADDDHILGFIVHHIAVDFWSLELLLDELSQLYAIETTTTSQASGQAHDMRLAQFERPSGFQHADYVRWQNSMLQSEAGEQHWQYWQNILSGDLAVLNLPTDRPRPAVQSYKGASHILVPLLLPLFLSRSLTFA